MQAYLTFNGNAAEAMAFYAKALDGKVIFSMTFGESPMGAETPAEYKNKIMHAALEARGHKLMASDMPPGKPFEGHKGFSLSVQANSVDEGKKLFDALAQGGQVTMPYGPQFWAVGFGMLTDKFGVPWMVNCEK
ncbi:VOC family protein [Variovorax sp. OV700]|jgi:PhnB protein|uniref:VOC family protein n=1 Tax=Variovorax sp. OV700 TaxID=1882826 RepID=UPI00087E44CB|nr:VOC family protein [Variovorax sp. OV700]SDH95660.1 PhnB protein [Variovorax sp. OV700]